MLLAGTTIALGIIVCRIRKGVRSKPISNLTTHCKGVCINDQLHHVVYVFGYVHLKIKSVCVTVVSLFTHGYCCPCLLLSMITQIHNNTLIQKFCFTDLCYSENEAYNVVDRGRVIYEEIAKESS